MKKYQKYFLLGILSFFSFHIIACNNENPVLIKPELEFENHDDYAMWTSDKKKMLYYGFESFDEKGTYLLDMDGFQGTNKRKLTTNQIIQLSADGDWIYYYSYYYGIYKRRLEGDTNSILLNSTPELGFRALSPDGQWVIYDSKIGDPNGYDHLWKMKIDGSNKRKMQFDSTGGDLVGRIKWFGDGTRLAGLRYFANDGFDGPQIAIVDTGGRSIAKLTNDNTYRSDINISPDGNFISYSLSNGVETIWVMKTDGTEVRQLTTIPSVNPGWTPDSRFITYTNVCKGDGRIWAIPLNGGIHTKITE